MRGANGAGAAPAELCVDLVVEQLRRDVPGGIGTYCRGLVLGIAAMPAAERPRVTLRASRPPRRAGDADPLATFGLPVTASSLPGPLLTRVWDRGVPLGWLRRADGERPSPCRRIVHGTSFATPPVRGQPVVAMVHDLAWRRFPEGYPERGRAWHEAALSRLARVARAFVVPSELTASDLLSADLGISDTQVHVIEEGVDHLQHADDDGADRLLGEWGIGRGDGFLLTVGTLEPRKNLRRLVEAYGAARPRLPEPWPLVVVGPRGWSDGHRPLDRAPAGVIPVGPVGDGVLHGLYRRARCVAYVPVFEGFGLPAGEAMLAGAPVVATAGLPSAGGAGVQVDPSDPSAIAAALVEATVDGPGREALRASGSRRAADLTWERCARAHVALWAEVGAS